MEPQRLPDINLLPNIERQSNLALILFIILLSLTLIAFVVTAYFYFSTKSKLADTSEELSKLEEEITELEVDLSVAESVEFNLETAVLFAEYYDIPTSVLIKEVEKYLPATNPAHLSELTYQNREASIITQFESLDSLAEYTNDLQHSKFIKQTNLNTVDTFTVGEMEIEADDFTTVPRYQATFQLILDKEELKGAKEDE
ncbi:MAG TPA: hypothetical protein VK067_03640 [Pseudogracilibacillus sp.]|nr:hypothetical protein [Pseudogracilibacillus sp.]